MMEHDAMNRMSLCRLAAPTLLACAVVFSGCTGADDQATDPGETSSTSSSSDGSTETTEMTTADQIIAFAEPDADDFNKLLDSEENLVDPTAATILNVEAMSETGLVLAFEMESHHCFGPRTTVEETDTEILIELRTGQRADVDRAACTYGVYPYTTAVELEHPVGSRTITPAEDREPEQDAAATATDDPPSTSTTVDDGDDADVEVTVPEDDTGPVAGDAADHLLGEYIEDGVEWAIDNGFAWRVASYDGVAETDDTSTDPERLSFVVERDRIVSYDWS